MNGWLIFAGIVVVLLIYNAISTSRNSKEKLNIRLDKEWGRFGSKKLTSEQLESIAHYYLNSMEGENTVDDITWNDCDMNRVFRAMNTTNSSVGQECLYRMLRVLEKDEKVLKDRDVKARYFSEHKEERNMLSRQFSKLGYCKSVAYFDYVQKLCEIGKKSNIINYLLLLLTIASLATLLFVNTTIGVIALILMVFIDVGTYYKMLAEVQPFFVCVKIVMRMIMNAKEVCNMHIDVLKEDENKLNVAIKELSFLGKYSAFISSGTKMDTSLSEMLLMYLRILTHVDLIAFNNIAGKMTDRKQLVIEFSKTMGDIEATIAIASFREAIGNWCTPQLSASDKVSYDAVEMGHPLIKKPVYNSIKTDSCVLLTGSNASGKSTFIKTVAINSILAQTISTACAKQFLSTYCRVISSMALNDNLMGNESYYIVEIKSLKRIIDKASDKGLPVLCMIDEVLRGTNTIERIAASNQILESIAKTNALCFAATHDIELTKLLETSYENYHFEEQVLDNDVKFDYKLKNGPATTRNAIKLLKIMGYDETIVAKAEAQAEALLLANN